jgi:hypothetical protein
MAKIGLLSKLVTVMVTKPVSAVGNDYVYVTQNVVARRNGHLHLNHKPTANNHGIYHSHDI